MQDKHLKELYRYDKNNNSYHAVIDLDTYRDVYSEWDYSPMNNRDIDEDLLEYIMDCSTEIGLTRNMEIDFFIPKEIVNEEREKKSIKGFHHYFMHQIRKIKNERVDKFKKMIFLLIIGFCFLSVANLIDFLITDDFFSRVVSEGLIIGAWVAIWEIFNTIFFSIKKLNSKINHYKRLQTVPINYKDKIKE